MFCYWSWLLRRSFIALQCFIFDLSIRWHYLPTQMSTCLSKLWPCYEQCLHSLCKCPHIIYLSNVIVPSLKEVEWGEHWYSSFPFPPFFKCNKYFLYSPPPSPFPFPLLETCQELDSLRWAVKGIERVIHTEPGFFVLHQKACCWPA